MLSPQHPKLPTQHPHLFRTLFCAFQTCVLYAATQTRWRQASMREERLKVDPIAGAASAENSERQRERERERYLSPKP